MNEPELGQMLLGNPNPLRSVSLNVEARPHVIIPWFESALAAIHRYGA